MLQLGFKMEEMVFNMADAHFFFNDIEVRIVRLQFIKFNYSFCPRTVTRFI